MSRNTAGAHLNISGNVRQIERDDSSRHDREGSISGSESSGYAHHLYGRDDFDHAEDYDPHLALTSQTLNADGTPKRPMNAFMIFARKRRPEISAANQMMRTGDISKVLSKEWNTMDMSEKKFYLDQAKKLKDNFNSKYPDYVYRRRPNNSRKKRKPDAGQQSPTDASPPGEIDDMSLEELSPVEGEDAAIQPSPHDHQYPRSHLLGASLSYEGADSLTTSHAPSVYDYPVPELPSGPFGHHPASRIHHTESSLSAANVHQSRMSSFGIPGSIPAGYHPHSVHHGQPSTSSSYASDAHANNHNPWDSARAPSRADQSRNWPPLPAIDVNAARYRQANTSAVSHSRGDSYSPQLHQRSWSATSSTPSSGSTPSTTHYPNANAAFPTLTSAFFPSSSPTERSVDMAPSPTSNSTHSPEYFRPPSQMSRRMSSADRSGSSVHEHVNFQGSPTISQQGAAFVSAPQSAGQWPTQYGARGPQTFQRMPPALHPISTYPNQPSSATSTSPSSSSSGPHSATQMGYWERNRFDSSGR
ncbi:hypothetical protein CERSUDRAFT_109878 [Gelatoporia subvermispora B]|uniref:HMG box domain-containing protein n=1 Tax=Ceriporiopsis subvermispora (strain B) TaxID=914234 RepID=M2PWS0_CERS8|nr:hypothetical protein CERSUDRAFT_109878 [Gelatoporia subvermispora B]